MTLERWAVGDTSVTKVFETMLDHECAVDTCIGNGQDYKYDNDRAQAVRSVESLVDLAIERSALIFGRHFPAPTTGRVHRDAERLEWRPC